MKRHMTAWERAWLHVVAPSVRRNRKADKRRRNRRERNDVRLSIARGEFPTHQIHRLDEREVI